MGPFASRLQIKIQPDDVSGIGDIASYHSMISLPTGGPQLSSS